MARHHNAHRRRKRRAGHAARLGIAGAVTGVVGVAAVAAAIVALRPHHGHETDRDPQSIAAKSAPATGHALAQLRTGTRFGLSTPDGYTYSIAAVKAGTADQPLATTQTPPPSGATLAYVDYVITNTGSQRALLDFPADLFVERSLVPPALVSRCMPQPGAPENMCTLPNHTDLVNTLGFPPPTEQDGDQYIPAGATYLVRVATDAGVSKDTKPDDLGLYIWNPRFIPNREAVKIELP